jgi:hypothetical protein
MTTNFSKKCEILSELWINYRDDENLQDFVSYNDMGLPLAYFIHTDVVSETEQAKMYINETWDVLLAALEAEDKEYNSLTELMSQE